MSGRVNAPRKPAHDDDTTAHESGGQLAGKGERTLVGTP